MIDELKPVWKQFVETYDALEIVIAEIPDERLHWSPSPGNWNPAHITTHIARGNVCYANLMATGKEGERPPINAEASRAELLRTLDLSLDRVRAVFRELPAERLHSICASKWAPLGYEVKGNQDALWFAMQIVRHTAYHLGQLTYISLMA